MSHKSKKQFDARIDDIISTLSQAESITCDHVQNLLTNLELYTSIDEVWDNLKGILTALAHGSPAFTGQSRINGSVIGPVWMHDATIHGGLIFGCGAIVLQPGMSAPGGSVIWLRGGRVIRSLEELKGCIVGNLNDGKPITANT